MPLIAHKQYLSAYGFAPDSNHLAVVVMTVLSYNDDVGDCAAYRGVVANGEDPNMPETVRASGSKISEEEACILFPEIEKKRLRYRR